MAAGHDSHYLRSLFHSDCSRVFNCDEIAKKLIEEGAPVPFFFATPRLNFTVIFKEAILDPTASRDRRHQFIGTKLMFPSDTHFSYQGDRTIYLHDAKLVTVLRQAVWSDDGTERSAIDRDMAVLGILDRLPSFDPFLTRDALETAGVGPNPRYFSAPDREHHGIREFIRRKLEPLVRRALDGQAVATSKTMLLVNKLWEATDARALAPLAQALRFPIDDAPAIFSAWKSINVYGFRYVQTKPMRDAFALWLRDQARAKDFSSNSLSGYLDLLRRDVMTRLRHHWRLVEEITREHDQLYDDLLHSPQGVPPFLGFLKRSRILCWRMGFALSKIDHAVGVWRSAMAIHPLGVVPADDLRVLLSLLNDSLIVERPDEAEATPPPALAQAS